MLSSYLSGQKALNLILASGMIFFSTLYGNLAAAVVITADFQDGTIQNWDQPFGRVKVMSDSGPAGPGDFAIEARPHPSFMRLFPQNTATPGFLGDYLDQGIVSVTIDAMNPASSEIPLQIHAVLFSSNSHRWVSSDEASVPNDGVWRSFHFSLLEEDMVHALGSNSFETDFTNVTRFGFRHQLIANQQGGSRLPSENTLIYLDNIRLISVPEPTGMLLILGPAVLALLRRSRAHC